MSFEETELRLGLPGNGRSSSSSAGSEGEMTKKRGFHETITTMADLKLNNLISSNSSKLEQASKLKAQAVGWPPIRSYRKNSLGLQIKAGSKLDQEGGGSFVKVSLDGAPYLRKLDLNIYTTYTQLSQALANLFAAFTSNNIILGNCESQAADGMKDLMNENKLIIIDLFNNTSDYYVPTYQDKDGDWMLVGDVPWQMFVESCKRLRIMKGKERKLLDLHQGL